MLTFFGGWNDKLKSGRLTLHRSSTPVSLLLQPRGRCCAGPVPWMCAVCTQV